MKIKKVILMALSLALVAAVAIGGTLAYLTSTDSDVNVMTLGNVSIVQHEYERVVDANGNYVTGTFDNVTSYVLKDFTQGKPLLPATELDANGNPYNYGAGSYDPIFVRMSQVGSQGGVQVFDSPLAVDKIVTVENTGKFDAYVRTLIAFEIGSCSQLDDVVDSTIFMLDQGVWSAKEIGKIEVDGNNYYLFEYIYNGGAHLGGIHDGVLPAGETSYPSLCQVYMKATATNEDVEAIDGNNNGTYDILVISQAVQAAGFDNAQTALDTAFGDITTTNHPWANGVKLPTIVNTVAELQTAIDAAVNGDTIVLGADIEGDVTVTQKAGVKITVDGNGKKFAGVITVDGKSATYTTAGLTVKNVNFVADSISADACIRLGNGTNATRYTCNVTVEGCTFDVPEAVGVKSYTGGDKNLTITGCTATAQAHSLAQLKGIDGVLVEKCVVKSIRGINFNNSDNIVVKNSTIDVQKYAVRFGESNNTTVENYEIIDCTIASDNVDGDAAVVLRAGATNAKLTLTNTTITAGTKMSGHENANIIQ